MDLQPCGTRTVQVLALMTQWTQWVQIPILLDAHLASQIHRQCIKDGSRPVASVRDGYPCRAVSEKHYVLNIAKDYC
eukprot:SAG31_NODE_1093_length_9952_cov_16.099056_7_plen_77_part_00